MLRKSIEKFSRSSNKLIGIWRIMVPAMAQAMLLSLLGVVDLILIGSVMGATKEVINGTTAASFIVSFVLYSIAAITVSGNIYYGQFLKSKFYGKIRETTNFKILASTVVFLFFLALFYLVGQARLVKLVYNNPTAVKQGAFYMKWLMLSTLPLILISPFYATLNAEGKSWIVLVNSLISVTLNVGFVIGFLVSGYQLEGVVLGSLCARLIELLLLLIYVFVFRPIWRPTLLPYVSKWSLKKLSLAAAQVWPSESLYPLFGFLSLFITVHAATPTPKGPIYPGAHDYIAVNNLVTAISKICFSLTVGFYAAVPSFVGSHLGRNQFQLARDNSKFVFKAALIVILSAVLFLVLCAWWWPYVFYNNSLLFSGPNHTPNRTNIFIIRMSIWSTCIAFGIYACAVQLFVIIRSGGYQWQVSLADQLPWFAFYLPLHFLFSYYLKNDIRIWWIQFMYSPSDLIQLGLAIFLYRKLPWHQKNLVQSHEIIGALLLPCKQSFVTWSQIKTKSTNN